MLTSSLSPLAGHEATAHSHLPGPYLPESQAYYPPPPPPPPPPQLQLQQSQSQSQLQSQSQSQLQLQSQPLPRQLLPPPAEVQQPYAFPAQQEAERPPSATYLSISSPYLNYADPLTTTLSPTANVGALGAPNEAMETIADQAAGRRPETGGPSLIDPTVLMESAGDYRLVSNLSASDVQFFVSNQEPQPPTLEQLRDRVIKQHPFLYHRFEPGNKARKPHENPPAVDKALRARFKPLTPEEEQARIAALKVKVESVMEQSVIRGIVVLERREAVWKPLAPDPPSDRAGDVDHVDRAPPLPSAWLLPLDTSGHVSMGKSKSKKTYRLPEFEAMAGCSDCETRGQKMCPLCRNAEPDECFWCEGTGIRRGKTCENCHGRKIHACLKCEARGTVPCKSCGGNGQVYVGAFVDVKFRTVALPSIAVKDLHHPGTGQPPARVEEVAQCAQLKMAHTIQELSRNHTSKSRHPSIPVMARVVWHKSVKRIVSIWRPIHVEIPKQRKLGLRKHHTAEADGRPGETHRFLVPSDTAASIAEINAATAMAAMASGRNGSRPSTPGRPLGFSPSVFGSPAGESSSSGINTPSASVSNLHALWKSPGPTAPPPPVPAIPQAYTASSPPPPTQPHQPPPPPQLPSQPQLQSQSYARHPHAPIPPSGGAIPSHLDQGEEYTFLTPQAVPQGHVTPSAVTA